MSGTRRFALVACTAISLASTQAHAAWPWWQPPPQPTTSAPSAPAIPSIAPADIQSTSKKTDVWDRAREYVGHLADGTEIDINAEDGKYSFEDKRMLSGRIQQKNGRWMSFEPKAIADRIVNPDLLEQVTKFSRDVKALDDAWIASNPDQFTDKDGTLWKRVPGS